MRVSKVSVEDDNRKQVMVLMQRSSEKGSLVFEGQNNVDKTNAILPKKKTQSFNLSIENKTLKKRDSFKNKDWKVQKEMIRKHNIVRDILTKTVKPNSILDQDILPFLNHKFAQDIKYYPTKEVQAAVCFNLCKLIKAVVDTQSFDALKPYYDWKEWYIKTKSDSLKISIVNNKINPNGEDNNRQKALNQWAVEYVRDGKIDLKNEEDNFNISSLVESLITTYETKLKDVDFKKKTNEFHRALKSTLQSHQKEIFGSKDAPNTANRENEKLHTYQIEVVKYMEHYFPVKASKRRNTENDIKYYLSEETIKKTVKNQIINSVRARLLQQGKAQHHNYADKNIDSTQLSDIKRNEAFVLNLIDACAFAANNIRNIVDNEQENDIIGKQDFKNSLGKSKTNPQLFKLFYNQELTDNANNKTLWAMRGSVQQIRNEIVHYKQDALDKIFKVKTFEFADNGDTDYTESIFKTCLENEIRLLPKAFAEQLKTGGTLAFYPLSDIKQWLNNSHFTLYRSVIPFTPGFKKVYKQGQDFQNAEKDSNFYDLKINAYPEIDFTKISKEYQAYYFTLKLIYNNWFLPEFTSNNTKFAEIANEVILINKTNAAKTKHPKAYAFEAVRRMNNAESIKEYMAYIQSQWMQEENKKEDLKPDEKNINFEKFMLQVFIKGFDMFVAKNKQILSFVSNPVCQLSADMTNRQQADKLNELENQIATICDIKPQNIDSTKSEHIAFYTFAKLLDANHLSALRNELIKYNASDNQKNSFSYVSELLELCLYSCDQIPNNYLELYADADACLNGIKPFIAEEVNIHHLGDLFVKDDKQTPEIHANIELSKKYGTASLLVKLMEDSPATKITEDDYTTWHKEKEQIETYVKEKEQLREQWLEAKKKDEKFKKTENQKKKEIKGYKPTRSYFEENYIKNNKENYKKLTENIEQYNWLDNKLHFVHLNRIHLLTIDILGRLAGFIALYDRDFQMIDARNTSDLFQLKAFVSLRDLSDDLDDPNKPISKVRGIEYIEKRNKSVIIEADRTALINAINKKREHYKKVLFCVPNPYGIRNDIAHFNYLSKNEKDENKKTSIIQLINNTRDLLSYDRKLKNAVTKSIIEIFDKHGMELHLEFENYHKLKVVSVEPKKLYHLGTKGEKGITTNQVHLEYAQLCKVLLEMKK